MHKVRPKEFIHLNLVSQEEEEEEEVKSQCLLLQLHGDVAAIKKKRRPMEMEDIGISEDHSTVILPKILGQPHTNCNKSKLNCFCFLNISTFTGKKS